MAQRNQVLTLKRDAKVNWLPPGARKVVPAIVLRVEDSTEDYIDVLIELLRPGGGYVKGNYVHVSHRSLSARGR